jgi:asparagine synthase (glutamine-hydrolysing)
MCGIAGAVQLNGSQPVSEHSIRRMTAALRHRGPDSEGIWVEGGVGLGSRRLAVIDLSPAATQPLVSADGSLRLVFNGEIYNFRALRAELEGRGHRFHSATDGETILHLYEEEGVDCLRHLRGMFAFALWDGSRRTLFIARDRLGKKPLLFHAAPGLFLFASEAKAILQDRRISASPDYSAIHDYLTYGYVPPDQSAFQGIRRLPPGHYLLLRDGVPRIERYWTLRYAPKRRQSEAVLAEELETLLSEAVRLRLESDVPLGVLLSGGLDSSTVVALMRRLGVPSLRTFSIGFEHAEYDELPYARQVARRFETQHHERVVKPAATEVLPRLAWYFDEPFADSSALPVFALCELAREFVTVALSGDGGDEAFLGYDRYRALMLGGWLDRLPFGVRRALAASGRLLPAVGAKSPAHRLRRLLENAAQPSTRRYGQWIGLFSNAQKQELYEPEFAHSLNGRDSFAFLERAFADSDASELAEAAAYADVQLYLPGDLLVKMDLASMAHSLEVRSPFLDHRVVEFAATLPRGLKLRGLTQKYLLRRVMADVLPGPVLRRAKMGFGVPIDHWFRRDLHDLAHDLLLGPRARARGYFRTSAVARLLTEHAAGRADHHGRLWSLLMLELWHRSFIDSPRAAGGTPES